MTRFQIVLGGTALLATLVLVWFDPVTRIWPLTALCTLAGLIVGLGVSFPQWQMFGPSVCRIRTHRSVVALTFDDGPDPESTPALLELLAKRRVRATFFCAGASVARQPELAKRIVAEGHSVENHSFEHSLWTNLFSVRRLRQELTKAQDEIRRATGRAPGFFRPPMGLTNQRIFRVASELGLKVAGYTARGLDRRVRPPEKIVARLLRKLQPGAIFLLHDGGVRRDRLVAMVTMLLDALEPGGYQCLRLDEMETFENT